MLACSCLGLQLTAEVVHLLLNDTKHNNSFSLGGFASYWP